MKHTPTPWKIGGNGYAISSDSIVIAKCLSSRGEYNAKRIVACVNAMEGIEDPASFVKHAEDNIQTITVQHKDLRHAHGNIEALEKLVHQIISNHVDENIQGSLRAEVNLILGIQAGGGQ